MIDKKLLSDVVSEINVALSPDALDNFDRFACLLTETNKTLNLTAITEPKEIVTKHFADSLTLIDVGIPENAKVIDVGTGGGFPALPLLISRNDIDITMIDGANKKLNFVRSVCEDLGFDAEILHCRAEELGKDADYREQYDVATARAVSALNVIAEYCLPFVKVGGTFLAMKSAKADEELEAAKKAIKLLGGEIVRVCKYDIADCGERNIIVIKKISQTPSKYPRASAKIAKQPL